MKIYINKLEEGLNELTHVHNAESLDLLTLEDREDCFIHPINIRVSINKVSSQFFFNVSVDTKARFICDRCLDEFTMELKDNFRLVYTLEKDYVEDEDNTGIKSLGSESDVIDISGDIREALLISIPMKTLCSEDCKGICSVCGVNRNKEECNHKDERIDPRWEALKSLVESDKNKK